LKSPKDAFRELTRARPSREEEAALYQAFQNGAPIVVAILGQALLEQQLETLLREKFKPKQGSSISAWEALTADNGPLNTFNQKIVAGFSFGIYDEVTKKNLNVIRDIRNVFAHSKKVISFQDPGIIWKLKSISIPEKRRSFRFTYISLIRKNLKGNNPDGKAAFITLCDTLYGGLISYRIKSLRTSTSNYRRKRLRIVSNALTSLDHPFGVAESGLGMIKYLGLTRNDGPRSPTLGPSHPESAVEEQKNLRRKDT
jgi:DNA-binding MltR family transcriptional regulator